MNKLIIAAFLFLFSLNAPAQLTPLSDLWTMEPCVNIACVEKPLKAWIDSFTGKLFVADHQFSISTRGDNRSEIFSLLSRKRPLKLGLPQTPLTMVIPAPKSAMYGAFKTNPLTIQYTEGVKAFTRSFNPVEFDYSLYDYFRLGCYKLIITEEELLSNTTLRFVYPNYEKKESNADVIAKDIKKKLGIKVKVPKGDNQFSAFLQELKNTKIDLYKLIFDTYINDTSAERASYNFQKFFPEPVMMDKLRESVNIQLKLALGETGYLLVPQEWISNNIPPEAGFTKMPFELADFVFDRENHSMEIAFNFNTSDTVKITSGANRHVSVVTGTREIYTATNSLNEVPEKITIAISLSSILISVHTKYWNVTDLYEQKLK